MAFSYVSQGDGATLKPYYGSTGYRTEGPAFTIPVSTAHVSPDTGTQPCLSESVNMALSSGGSCRLYIGDPSRSGYAYSSGFTPGGSVNSSSARTSITRGVSKTLLGGSSYVMGALADGAGLGFLRTGAGTTILLTGGLGVSSSWAGTQQAILYYNTIPSAPSGLTASPGAESGSVDLAWVAPVNNGGATIDGYRIEWSDDDFATVLGSVDDTGSTALSHTVEGLADGVLKFRVAALNAVSRAHAGTPASIRSNVVEVEITSGNVQRYTGSTSETVPMMRYNGSTSSPAQLMRWNGSESVPV